MDRLLSNRGPHSRTLVKTTSAVPATGKVYRTVIYYTSELGFVGADPVEFERIGVRGAYGYHIYTINVR